MKPNKTANHIQAKKNYVQAVRTVRKAYKSGPATCDYYAKELEKAKNELQRLGIEPNYSLIVKELKGL